MLFSRPTAIHKDQDMPNRFRIFLQDEQRVVTSLVFGSVALMALGLGVAIYAIFA
jgi:hypothetical protein